MRKGNVTLLAGLSVPSGKSAEPVMVRVAVSRRLFNCAESPVVERGTQPRRYPKRTLSLMIVQLWLSAPISVRR